MENKKEYTTPIIEIIRIDDKDIVTTSFGTDWAGDDEQSFGDL